MTNLQTSKKKKKLDREIVILKKLTIYAMLWEYLCYHEQPRDIFHRNVAGLKT